jgi:large subunit ribosomal protein L5
VSRLKDFYRDDVIKQLTKQFGYKSVMEVPRVTKITLNMGVGDALTDKKVLEHAVSDMELSRRQRNQSLVLNCVKDGLLAVR